jgi:hypothetical protein
MQYAGEMPCLTLCHEEDTNGKILYHVDTYVFID